MTIRSMTGFAREEKIHDKLRLYVELRSVNNRYLDIKISTPQVYNPLYPLITKKISEHFSRGTLDITIKREVLVEDYHAFKVNQSLASKVLQELRELKTKQNITSDITISDLLACNITSSNTPLSKEDLDNEWNFLCDILNVVISSMQTMRADEGTYLWGDIDKHLSLIEENIKEIESTYDDLLEGFSDRIQERLNQSLNKLSNHMAINAEDPRFVMEFGYISERCDITEELTRLKAHLVEFRKLETGDEPVGRKMDFFLQEMNREINTIASKNFDRKLGKIAVNIKAEIEKIRQQVQNIE